MTFSKVGIGFAMQLLDKTLIHKRIFLAILTDIIYYIAWFQGQNIHNILRPLTAAGRVGAGVKI